MNLKDVVYVNIDDEEVPVRLHVNSQTDEGTEGRWVTLITEEALDMLLRRAGYRKVE